MDSTPEKLAQDVSAEGAKRMKTPLISQAKGQSQAFVLRRIKRGDFSSNAYLPPSFRGKVLVFGHGVTLYSVFFVLLSRGAQLQKVGKNF